MAMVIRPVIHYTFSSTVKKHAFLCVHVYTVHMIDA